jgi:glyoxylase-like metal-dependent hydrolase (beta-lactamase superfamily II)
MEIVPGIHRIEAPFGERMVCAYLLAGDQRTLLVDSGLDSTPRDFIVPYLQKIGFGSRRLDFVLTTHADIDHMGGNASLRSVFPDACFLAHHLDRIWIENTNQLIQKNYGQFDFEHGTRPDAALNEWMLANARSTWVDASVGGGETVRLGADWSVEIRHTPGHTRGHVSVIDPRNSVAIIADAALSDALYTRDGKSAFPPTYRFVEDYLRTARNLLNLSPKWLLTSHYPVMQTMASRLFLQRTIEYTARVETELVAQLATAAKPLSVSEIIEPLASKLGSWPRSADVFLMYPLLGHLEFLSQQKRILKTTRSTVAVYQLMT